MLLEGKCSAVSTEKEEVVEKPRVSNSTFLPCSFKVVFLISTLTLFDNPERFKNVLAMLLEGKCSAVSTEKEEVVEKPRVSNSTFLPCSLKVVFLISTLTLFDNPECFPKLSP